MNFLMDMLFVIISEILVNVVSGFAEVPMTLFTEFVLGLMGR